MAILAAGGLLHVLPASAALLVFDRSISTDGPYYTDIAVDGTGALLLSGFVVEGDALKALVSKRSSEDGSEIWSLQFGAAGGQIATGVAVDGQGNVYATGSTADPGFPLRNPVQATFGGGETDVFILKINGAGSSLLYSTFLGGADKDFANQIRVDTEGNVYVAGTTFSPDFDAAGSARSGQTDAFVVKLNASGSAFAYRRLLGGSDNDLGNGMAIDSQGRAYLIGSTASTDFPVVNPLQSNNRGGLDVFIARLDPLGNTDYATYLGGSAPEAGTGIAIDGPRNILVTGLTFSGDFPLMRPFQNELRRGDCPDRQTCGDGFVAKLNATGSALEFSTFLGGSSAENDTAVTSIAGISFFGMAVDSAGFAYVTGMTGSKDFPVLGGLQVTRRPVTTDPFLAKLQPDGGVVYSTYLGPGQAEDSEGWVTVGSSVAVDTHGNAYVAGASLPPRGPSGTTGPPQGYLAKVFDLPIIPASWTPLSNTGPSSLFLHISSVRRLADSSTQLSFGAPTNSGFVVEASADLRTWTNLFTQPPAGGSGGGGGPRR